MIQADLFYEPKSSGHSIIENRIQTYDKSHCWQYDIRLQNLASDLAFAGLTQEAAQQITTDEFTFSHIDPEDQESCRQVVQFIEKHEWLGKMPNRPTHRFVARYQNHLVGVIVFATPNTFSNLLGKENSGLEKLIARGACISWSPVNTASWLLMKSIRWMVKNTQFRFFTAYSDPEAKELGTIYQACNFFYLGQKYGADKMYLDPDNPDKGWFSDREFRKRSKYIRYAANLGMSSSEFEKHYMKRWTPDWSKMSEDFRLDLKKEEKKFKDSCLVRVTKPKHKYVYVLGENKRETKSLRNIFQQKNKKLSMLSYPKTR